MCQLLAYPYEVYQFTEECLRIILRNKKLAKNTDEVLREFATKFIHSSHNDYA